MVHVVHTFDKALRIVVHEDGIVVSSPKGLDLILTPEAAEATARLLTEGAEKALSAAAAKPGEPPSPKDTGRRS